LSIFWANADVEIYFMSDKKIEGKKIGIEKFFYSYFCPLSCLFRYKTESVSSLSLD